MPINPKTGKEYPYTKEGIDEYNEETGGMPFKMRGSPFQRNFGIGKTESPDATSTSPGKNILKGLKNVDLKAALGAGMATLPGGFDATKKESVTGYERDNEGQLKLDKAGNPIPIKETSQTKPYTAGQLFGDIKGFLNPEKEEE